MAIGTITIGSDKYSFCYSKAGKEVEIVYLDDNKYTFALKNMGVAYPLDYNNSQVEEKGYLDVLSIIWCVDNAVDNHNHQGREKSSMLVGMFIIALGAWGVFAPKSIWRISRGLWLKDAAPSEFATVFNRVVGGVIAIIGLIYVIAHI